MSFIIYPIYNPDIFIVFIFIALHMIDFLMVPFTDIKICYLELEYSSMKIATNTLIAYIIRTIISLTPTPFCTIIGQLCSSIYEFIYSNITYAKLKLLKK